MVRRSGMAIGIEFGELSTGLSALLGAAQGIMDQDVLDETFLEVGKRMTRDFGRKADAAGAEGAIAHVYEYNTSSYGVNASPVGRLWKIVWSKTGSSPTGSVVFRDSNVDSRPDPKLVSQVEAESGGSADMARHSFRDKAKHLETTKTLVSRAGIQRHTRRVGGTANPRMLVFLGRDGKPKFAKRYTRTNRFHNKFREFFMTYWMTQFEQSVEPKVKTGTHMVVREASGDVNRLVRKASLSVVRMPPLSFTGVYAMDHGKPYRGFRIRQSDVKAIKNKVKPKFKKEMLRRWRM